MKTDLQNIPGVGKKTEKYLVDLGYTSVASLKDQDPEEIYMRDCLNQGYDIDRCQLYVYRCAVYFASTPCADAQKLKWWYWKDKK